MFSRLKPKTHRGTTIKVPAGMAGVGDRQGRISGFEQGTLSGLTIVGAGAGGLGSQILGALARKGVGHVIVCDMDDVEPSNLSRQRFYKRDIGKNKALCLARNLAQESFLGSKFTGIPASFMEAAEAGLLGRFDCIISGIDDELARENIAAYALCLGVPLITVAVSEDGDGGYVQIQKPGDACWGCAFPRDRRLRDDLRNYRAPCPGTPAILDILLTVSGAAVYAVDALFMHRPLAWNYREFRMAGFMPDAAVRIERRADCQLCGGRAKEGTHA